MLPRESHPPAEAAQAPFNFNTFPRRSDLIRDSPKPNCTDFSARALIYRVATSPTGITIAFTWAAHYDILYVSLRAALIEELNRKLATGIDTQVLIRDIPIENVPVESKPFILFAKKGMQCSINWMWCSEHVKIMMELDLQKSELELEEVDQLVKATGGWVYEAWKKENPWKAMEAEEGQED